MASTGSRTAGPWTDPPACGGSAGAPTGPSLSDDNPIVKLVRLHLEKPLKLRPSSSSSLARPIHVLDDTGAAQTWPWGSRLRQRLASPLVSGVLRGGPFL